MSNRDEDEKITKLFPDADDRRPPKEVEEAPSSTPDERSSSSTSDERSSSSTPDERPSVDEDDGDEELENVVRPDFGSEPPGDDSSRSFREIVDDAKARGEDLEETKYELFCHMIDDGMVMVTLDSRFAGVDVPQGFRNDPELRLNFSHRFHIDDFAYDEDGVRASLSFDGERYFCDVPWASVFMLYSHETAEVVVFEPNEPE